MSDAYRKAGVDIDAGERLISAIKPLAKATSRPGTNAALGGFGGLFDLKATNYVDPILVSGTDGVGTKLRLAFDLNRHDTIGIDLVAMCANDVLAQGAEPLFFLDYFATGKLKEETATQVISGISDGCLQAGCALVGGETAEMPSMYPDGEYDVAGFCVGAVERSNIRPANVSAGDVLIGIASTGAHSNGYSLIRKIIADNNIDLSARSPFDPSKSIGEALLTPTRIYVKSILPLITQDHVHGFAHITGGGLTDNVPRILPPDLQARYDHSALEFCPFFSWLQDLGELSEADMRRTFNCGIGGVVSVEKNTADNVLQRLEESGERAFVIGDVVKSV